MGRGKTLNDLEKGKILAFFDEKMSFRQIAKKINRSDHVVRNFLKNQENYGKQKSSGRKSKLTERNERQICNCASNSTKTCAQIANECNVQVSKWTIGRVLKKSKHIQRQKMKLAPKLTPVHKSNRLEFAKNNMQTNWAKIIFSDEKKFNLDGPDGFNTYWRDLRKDPMYFSRRNFGGGNLMIWGAFCADGMLEIAFPSSHMNSTEYVEIMQMNLLPFLNARGANYWCYQQDNARIHVSRQAKSWFDSQNIKLLEWPACSPDLNPMENIWGILVRRIYANNKQYQDLNELKQAIIDAYTAVSNQEIQNLINSMPNRLYEVIKNKGGVTNY